MPLVFHHIPKTGGSSVHQALVEELHLKAHPERHGGFGELPHEALLRFDLLSSHFWPSDLTHLETLPDAWFATLLRDPVERFISEYDFFRTRSDEELRRLLDPAPLLQARHSSPEDYFRFVIERRQDNRMTRSLWPVAGEVTEADVGNAIGRLETFAVVGISDFLDEFLEILFERLGRKRDFQPVFVNTRGNFKDPSRADGVFTRTQRSDVEEATWHEVTWADARVFRHFEQIFLRDNIERIVQTRKAYGKWLQCEPKSAAQIQLENHIKQVRASWRWRLTRPLQKLRGLTGR